MERRTRKKLCKSILSDHEFFSSSVKKIDSLWKTASDGGQELSRADEEEFLEIIDSLIFQHEILIQSYQEKDNE